MNRRTCLLAAAVMVATFVTGTVASASVAGRERSTKVTVTGAALPTSDALGSPDDPAIGKTVPTLAGKGFDGQAVTFTGDGKPRLVLFVAHWCPHCQREVPLIVKLAKKGKLDGIEVQTVATNTDSSLPNYPPSKWLAREHWPFTPVLADDAKSRALVAFGGTTFPFFVLVGSDGKVVARASGELSPNQITVAAKNLAAGKSVFD